MFRKLLISVVLMATLSINAQDAGFTQYFTNPIYYNPALSGVNGGLNVRSNYRNFWRKMDKGFNTMDITIDSQEPFLSGGIGFIALSGMEGNGIIKTQMFGLSYSYNLLVIPRKFDIQMGLQGAYVQKHFQIENLIFSDQLDPIYGNTGSSNYSYNGIDNVIYPDFSSGINFRFNAGKVQHGSPFATINLGLALHHITQPNESFTGLKSPLPIKYVTYANTIIRANLDYHRYLFITPGFIYEQQSIFKTMLVGSNIMLKPLYVGFWFRNNGFNFGQESLSSIALNAGIKINMGESSILQIGYSYDINISQYQNLMGDTHEVSLSIQFDDLQLFNTQSMSRKARHNKACFNKF